MNTSRRFSLVPMGLIFLFLTLISTSSVGASWDAVGNEFITRQMQAVAAGQPDPCNTAEGATYGFWCAKWSANPIVPANAYANPLDKSAYTSLHQYRNIQLGNGYSAPTINHDQWNDANKNFGIQYNYFVGIKNQWNPNNWITSCAIGIVHPDGCDNSFHFSSSVSSHAANEDFDELSFSIPSFRNTRDYPIVDDFKYKNFKVFVPAGTSNILGAFYFPQSIGKTSYAYAVRMGQPPKRSAPLTAEEYVSYEYEQHVFSNGTTGKVSTMNNTIASNFKSFLTRLADGDEVFLTHDGGGSIYFGNGGGKTKPLQKGAWVYFRQLQELPGNPYLSSPILSSIIKSSDKQLFLDEYRNMKWQANGDPVEEVIPQNTILAPVSVTLASNTSFYLTTSSLAMPGDIKQIMAQNGKVTLSWKSQGMTLCTFNGQDIGLSGEKAFTGLTTDGAVYYYKCTNATTGRSASMYFTVFNNPFQDCSAPGSCGQGLPPTMAPGNPYESSLSAANLKVLTAWITKNITNKETVLTSTKYITLIDGVIVKFNTLAKNTKNKNVLTKINYLIFELKQIKNKIEDEDSSFLDDIFN